MHKHIKKKIILLKQSLSIRFKDDFIVLKINIFYANPIIQSSNLIKSCVEFYRNKKKFVSVANHPSNYEDFFLK